MKPKTFLLLTGSLLAGLATLTPAHAAVDAAAAEELMEANKCFQWHAIANLVAHNPQGRLIAQATDPK